MAPITGLLFEVHFPARQDKRRVFVNDKALLNPPSILTLVQAQVPGRHVKIDTTSTMKWSKFVNDLHSNFEVKEGTLSYKTIELATNIGFQKNLYRKGDKSSICYILNENLYIYGKGKQIENPERYLFKRLFNPKTKKFDLDNEPVMRPVKKPTGNF